MIAPRLRLSARLLLGAVTVAAVLPARAQVFRTEASGRAVSDVQGYNLAGGGNHLEIYWPVSTRLRTYPGTNPVTVADIGAGQPSRDVEVRGLARESYGAEARLSLPAAPWLFGTLEYRRANYDEFRLRGNDGVTEYRDLPDDEVDADTYRVGLGVAVPNTPFYARGEYSVLDIDGLGVDRRFDGYGVHAGFVQPLTSFLGVRAEAGYQDLEVLGDGFEWKAGLNLNLTAGLALTGTYRAARLRDARDGDGVNTRVEDVTVGLRFQFGR